MTLSFQDARPGRPQIIMTSTVSSILKVSDLFLFKKSQESLAVITGPSGIGKTTALDVLRQHLAPRQQLIVITASHYLTPSRFVLEVVERVGDTQSGQTASADRKNLHRAFEFLHQQEPQCFLIDEADNLPKETWVLLQALLKTSSVLLMGLPSLLDRIKQDAYLFDRLSINISLQPLDVREIIDVVLPNLIFDHWVFHPHNKQDCELGHMLWSAFCPAISRLINCIRLASCLASYYNQPTITRELLLRALDMASPSCTNSNKTHFDLKKKVTKSRNPSLYMSEENICLKEKRVKEK